jgi:outer membrane protein assembly factor BamB
MSSGQYFHLSLSATLLSVSRVLLAAIGFITAGRMVDRVSGADWPQWRGPDRNAVSSETGLLTSWPDGGPRMAWQATGVGSGYASVAVSGGRVFTLGKVGSNVVVTALMADAGTPVWSHRMGTTTRNPCSTPTVDGDRVYALGPDGDLVCLRVNSGELVWQKHLVRDFGGKMMSGRGYGESPLVDGEQIIVTPGADASAIVALDKRSGALIWTSKLPVIGPAGREGAGFSSVVVIEAVGLRQYVQLMGRGLVGVEARDGRFLWSYNPIANGTVNIPTPVVRRDLVFAANGYNAGGVLLRLVPAATATSTAKEVKAEVVYTTSANQFQNHHGGVILIGEHLYGGHGSNNGLPTCLELHTGKILWKQRGPGVGSAAVAYADGRLYFRYQNGLVALLAASPTGYELHGTLQVPGAAGDSWPHPAIAGGRLFLREQDKLFVYELRQAAPTIGTAKPVETSAQASAVLEPLTKQGIAVEALAGALLTSQVPPPAKRPAPALERSRRLYRFAIDDKKSETRTVTQIITLTDKHLTSEGTLTPSVLGDLRRFPMPVILNLAGTRLTDAGLRQVTTLPRLVGLNLEFCNRVTDAGLASLQQLPELRTLILMGTGVTHSGIKSLSGCNNLRALDLEVCDGVTDAVCETLGTFISLRALILKKTAFEPHCLTDAGLRSLRNLRELQVLHLSGNKFTDAGMQHLTGLAKLRELNLNLLAITDAGLVPLQKLPELRQLDLLYSEGFAGPKITNVGVAHLVSLSGLHSLDLTGAQLTDDSVGSLRRLAKLSSLKLTRTQISGEGLRKLRESLPVCEIAR